MIDVLILGVPEIKTKYQRPVLNVGVLTGILQGRNRNEGNSQDRLTEVAEIDAITQTLGIIAVIISSIALFFTIRSYHRSKKNEQVKIAHDIMSEMRRQTNEYNMLTAEIPLDEDGKYDKHYQARMDRMMDHIFGDMNWLCYLIEEKVISDPELSKYFDDVIVQYYKKHYLPNKAKFEKDFPKPFRNFVSRAKKLMEKREKEKP